MSSHIRLLPTLIGAAGVLLFLRIGAMAADTAPEPAAPAAGAEEGAGQGKAGAEAGPAPAPKEAPKDKEEAGGEAKASAAGSSTPTPMSRSAISLPSTKGEADVLERLAERRAALEAREKDVALREKMLAATERQMDAKLSELKQLEQKLEVLVTKRNELEETQISGLVKTYESMKPEDAARIFNRLERGILVDVASRMKPAKIGAVLAAMEAARAQDLTVLLARRLKVSLNAPAAPAAPATPPPAPPAEAAAPPNG